MFVITNQQMIAAEKSCTTSGELLMERAGSAVSHHIIKSFPKQKILVICGPGNKGGDGFVVARILQEKGWEVVIMLSGKREEIKNEAAIALQKLHNEIISLSLSNLLMHNDSSLIVDAIFGTGLSRPITQDLSGIFDYINSQNYKIVSIDVPSGINGSTGEIMGNALKALCTVTFSTLKVGHVLNPGHHYSGEVIVTDIGIKIDTTDINIYQNIPELWLQHIPRANYSDHKYTRGYSLIYNQNIKSVGASKLAAMAALRIGAGSSAIACSEELLPIYASCLTTVMYKLYGESIHDKKVTAILVGPGNGVNDITKKCTLEVLKKEKLCS